MNANLTEDSTTFMKEVEAYMTFKAASYINDYWFPILTPIALVGNTLSFLVMIKPNNRKVSTCIYMAAISINDNLLLCFVFHNWLRRAIGFQWLLVQCKVVSWLTAFAMQNSRYQILAMTIDKYVAIKWPHKAASYSTSKRAKIIITGVFICTLIENTHHIPMSGLVRGRCRSYVVGGIISVALTWVSFFVNGFIPFSMLIYMNYVIVQTIKNSGKMFGSTSKSQHVSDNNKGMETRQRKMKSAENQLTIMLLLVTILYLVLQIPSYIRNIYTQFVKQDTSAKYANYTLILLLTYALSITSNGINFFLYCISGKKFRNDFVEILSCNETTFIKNSELKSNQVFTLSVSHDTDNSTVQCDRKN